MKMDDYLKYLKTPGSPYNKVYTDLKTDLNLSDIDEERICLDCSVSLGRHIKSHNQNYSIHKKKINDLTICYFLNILVTLNFFTALGENLLNYFPSGDKERLNKRFRVYYSRHVKQGEILPLVTVAGFIVVQDESGKRTAESLFWDILVNIPETINQFVADPLSVSITIFNDETIYWKGILDDFTRTTATNILKEHHDDIDLKV